MASLKPILHGRGDPSEIPYYCKKCEHFRKCGSNFPTCDRREDGKFRPEVAFTCLVLRKNTSENKESGND